MKKSSINVLGAILVVLGGIFTLQGLGYLGGSPMTGVTLWAIIGPILAVVGLLSFITSFGEFIIARIVLQSEGNWTLAVGLFGWVSDQLSRNWGLFTAGAVIAAVPVLILFLFLQKYIVGGLTAGSVKG